MKKFKGEFTVVFDPDYGNPNIERIKEYLVDAVELTVNTEDCENPFNWQSIEIDYDSMKEI